MPQVNIKLLPFKFYLYSQSKYNNYLYFKNLVRAVCAFSCNNGECVADELCQCFDGWSGERCDEGIFYSFTMS